MAKAKIKAPVINASYELVPVDSLTRHPQNARQGDVGAVCASIEATGFFGALVVQKSTRHILAGNHRHKAAEVLGMASVAVTFVDVDDETALRILVADNRTSDLGTYDDESLVDLLQELAATKGGLDGVGYDGDDLDRIIRDVNVPSSFNDPSLNEPSHKCPSCGYEWNGKA